MHYNIIIYFCNSDEINKVFKGNETLPINILFVDEISFFGPFIRVDEKYLSLFLRYLVMTYPLFPEVI